ncbi:MAG: PGF-pre-PGF domain-containing protein [Halobacteriota archaeon]
MLVLLFMLAATTLFAGTAMAMTHTEVAGVTRYAPAGPAASEEFEVTLRISGELPLVVGIVETIPEGFSFPSSDVSSTPYKVSGQKISFAAIDEAEIKYTVIAPSSGDGTFTGEWADLLVLTTKLEEGKEGRWHTVAPEEGTTVIIGGGGAGTIEEEGLVTPTPTPFVPAVTKASRSIPVMEAGRDVAMVFEDMDVSMIALKADKNVSNVELKVERIERTPDIPAPSGIPYVYLDIMVGNAGGAKVEGKVEFKVANSWIADNNIDEATVTLNRYEGGEWKALPTSKTGEDNATVYFEAETPGFSMFAVTGEKKVEVEAAATPTPTTAVTAPTPAVTPTPSPTAPQASEVPGFEAIFAVVALLIVYTMVFGKNGKEGSE